MAASAIWIRHNMLGAAEQQRQLTDAEIRVQRSLQKLCIPEWYLNKRSTPPKVLRNITPIDCRPPSWKNPEFKRKSNIGMTQPTDKSVAVAEDGQRNKNISETGTYKIIRQTKAPEVNRSPRKSPSPSKRMPKDELLDTNIPPVTLPANISKTFPKVSPSRKIQNINIVFPPGPQLNIVDVSRNNAELCKTAPVDPEQDVEQPVSCEDVQYNTFVLKRDTSEVEQEDEDSNNDVKYKRILSPCGKTLANYSVCSVSADTCDVSLRTGNMECNFRVRAVSTPKRPSIGFLSSTLIEPPKLSKLPCEDVAERTVIADSLENTPKHSTFTRNVNAGTQRGKKLFSEEDFEEEKPKVIGSPRMVSRANLILTHKLRSLDPIVVCKDNVAHEQSPRKPAIPVREMAQKFDTVVRPRVPRNAPPTTEMHSASPFTKFFQSKKKSIELENIVKTVQPGRGKGLVKEIIDELSEKVRTSTITRQNRVELSNQNYVKQVVDAIEKGDTLRSRVSTADRRKSIISEESYSESDVKSATSSTSMSVKDTDSSSDSDQRSPSFRSDDDMRFDYSTVTSERSLLENQSKCCQTDEEDSVYWIPVSRCKLPRTSSLLSMMSRLSANVHQSPCVSPIRSGSESVTDSSHPKGWGSTYKTSLPLELFRINETVVTDSGYSDKSNKNANSSTCSVTDATWSEETQNDSASEPRSPRLRKSCRRKTMIGLKSVDV